MARLMRDASLRCRSETLFLLYKTAVENLFAGQFPNVDSSHLRADPDGCVHVAGLVTGTGFWEATDNDP
jgi:hypothetical protein